ncbi:MAG: hypothetical protein EOO09_13280 [Chitinophagaceae bacterium]|nr:MAG: hypothetical protein EOO09_13280 [Chitinophagaceae bacterium]
MLDLSCDSVAQPAFKGKFSGEQPGIISSADLVQDGTNLSGTVTINGKKAAVSGTVQDSSITGTLDDEETDKVYAYTGYIEKGELHFSITFPELNNQVIELVMKQGAAVASGPGTKISNPNASRDVRLIGLWRYTEVLSSGSGSNYGSLATDYFMELKADGTLLSWTGKSAGGAGGQGVSSEGNANVSKGEWYTEAKVLVMVDPAKGEKASVQFMADANRIMFVNGNNKRVWQRVR